MAARGLGYQKRKISSRELQRSIELKRYRRTTHLLSCFSSHLHVSQAILQTHLPQRPRTTAMGLHVSLSLPSRPFLYPAESYFFLVFLLLPDQSTLFCNSYLTYPSQSQTMTPQQKPTSALANSPPITTHHSTDNISLLEQQKEADIISQQNMAIFGGHLEFLNFVLFH